MQIYIVKPKQKDNDNDKDENKKTRNKRKHTEIQCYVRSLLRFRHLNLQEKTTNKK